ncbi:serine-rich adhesin for platelets-like [Haliotis asinina]|uniref:serine-rich adhesin for platelets-like n=1 Tax=Haliotis asinina TaxID=109174 RepID=UPI00353227DB
MTCRDGHEVKDVNSQHDKPVINSMSTGQPTKVSPVASVIQEHVFYIMIACGTSKCKYNRPLSTTDVHQEEAMAAAVDIAIITMMTVTSASTLPTSMTTWTLYTDKRTWNEAQYLCEALGSELLFLKDAAMEQRADQLAQQAPWKTHLGFLKSHYIGLYNKVEAVPGIYSWLDCEVAGTITANWASGLEPVLPTTQLCLRWFPNGGFSTADCKAENQYVCEKVGGICNYEMVPDSRGVDVAPYEAGALSVSECQGLCDVAVEGTAECWGFTSSPTKCDLHFASDSTHFDESSNIAASTGEDLYKKACFANVVNHTSFPASDLVSVKPFTSCPGSAGTGNTSVYTLFSTNMTWPEARAICASNSQQLVVLRTTEDALRLHKLFGSHSLSFWIGLSGSSSSGFTWVDGSGITWHYFQPGYPPVGTETVCVTAVPINNNNTWITNNCQHKQPFVCQKPNVRCAYLILDRAKGLDYTNKGNLDQAECEGECQTTADCVGYSHYKGLFSKKCYLHTSQDPQHLFNPTNYETGQSSWKLYRWSCDFGLYFGEATVVQPVQGLNVSNLQSSSSMSVEITSADPGSSNVLTQSVLEESSLIDDTVVSFEVSESVFVTDGPSILSTESAFLTDEPSPLPTESVWGTEDPSIVPTESVFVTDVTSFETSVSAESVFLTDEPSPATPSPSSSFAEGIVSIPSIFSTSSVFQESSHIGTGDASLSSAHPTSTYNEILLEPSSPSVKYSTYLGSGVLVDLSSTVTDHPMVSSTEPTQDTTATNSYLENTFYNSLSSGHILLPSETTMSLFSASLQGAVATTDAKLCPCQCKLVLNDKDTSKIVQEIKEKLHLESDLLSKQIRKRTSAPDERPSSQGIGYVAITFLSFVGILLLLADSATLTLHIHMLVANLCKK